mgnify:CR=1 FL=1
MGPDLPPETYLLPTQPAVGYPEYVTILMYRGLFKPLAVVLSLWAGGLSLHAAEQNIRPGINKQYENPEFSRWVAAFEHSDREVFAKRHVIIKALNLKKGMHVADVGAGTGLFSLLIAQEIGPKGILYAVDISSTFIDNILRRAREAGLNQVVGLVSSQHDSRLAPNGVDLIFICDTYHHFEYPRSLLKSLAAALRPEGQLVIIDFHKKKGETPQWVMEHVRADKQEVIAEVEAAGFRKIEDLELMRTNYFLRFKRGGR